MEEKARQIAVKYVYGNNDALTDEQEVKDMTKDIVDLVKEIEAKNNELLHDVSTRFVIANITISDIVKGKKYELIETESMGYYIIDDTGEETYYNHSVLDVC